MRCDFCEKDACRNHRKLYWEYDKDYPDFCACQDCIPKADKCEYIAHEVAKRYESWREVVKRIYDNFEEYTIYLEGYTEPKEIKPIQLSDLYE
jgi:hypothetical protein